MKTQNLERIRGEELLLMRVLTQASPTDVETELDRRALHGPPQTTKNWPRTRRDHLTHVA